MKKFFATTAHTILRKIFYIVGGLFIIGTLLPAVSMGQQFSDTDFPYDIQGETYVPPTNPEATTNIAADLIAPDTIAPTGILQRLTDFFRLSGTTYYTGDSVATNYVKRILNILLGLVSFLALVMIIFAFYLIFFSKGEDGVTKAKKILIGVGIALAIMGLAYFITDFFFDLFTTVTQ